MNRLAVLAFALGLPLIGCGPPPPDQAKLASVCQLFKCECAKADASILSFKKDVQEIVWLPDGRASCPAGYILEQTNKPSIYDRPVY